VTRPVVLLALAASLAACDRGQAATVNVQTVPVERRDLIVDAEATGIVEPINVVEVKSKASGQITAMPVETGSLVQPGDLLVQLDTRDVQNQYDQALADVRAAEARLAVSEAQQKRSTELFTQRVITSQENEAAQLELANAQAQVVRARTNLDLAKQRLEDATVRAPVAGTVIEKAVSLGQVITSATGAFGGGTTLLKMADLNQVRMRALVNETDIGQVRPGLPARVTVDAYPDRPFRGVVEKIEPQAVVEQSVTMFPVLVSLTNREGLLKPGMNGEVSVLVERRENALAVPNDAVRSPREAMATAAMLGLDPDSVQAQLQAQFAQARGGRGAGGGQNGGAPVEVRVARGAVAPTEAQAEGDGRERRSDQVPEGRRERRRQGARGEQGAPGAPPQVQDTAGGSFPRNRSGAPRTEIAPPGESPAGPPASSGRTRPGLVFVAQNGTYVPRIVRLGIGNYDYTEVVSGLQEGQQVALLAAAALQAQRQQQNERFRGMGGVPGMQRQPAGGPPGGGRRGGGM